MTSAASALRQMPPFCLCTVYILNALSNRTSMTALTHTRRSHAADVRAADNKKAAACGLVGCLVVVRVVRSFIFRRRADACAQRVQDEPLHALAGFCRSGANVCAFCPAESDRQCAKRDPTGLDTRLFHSETVSQA